MKKIITAVALAAVTVGVQAAYPDRPIKMIVPWAAGGDTDNIFRPFGQVFQKHLGQTVVIANVGGASGTRGAKEAKDSPADGYTLYAVHDYIHPAAIALFRPVGSRLEDDFSDDDISPEVTATWRPHLAAGDLTLYVAYKKGFKAGGWTTSRRPGSRPSSQPRRRTGS